MMVAAGQFSAVPGDVGSNVRTMAGMVRAAGARVVVFAESTLTGYEPELVRVDPGLWVTADDLSLKHNSEPTRRRE
ncbi:hypothetical protein ACE14D_26135 [Streptomyces sp. Act-28]